MNKLIWLLIYYFYNIFFINLGRHFSIKHVTLSKNNWVKLKDEFGGSNSILVVGNGPSLNVSDLERFQKIPSIASNKIYLLFESTKWRPSCVTICDTLLAYKLRKNKFEGVDNLICAHPIYYMLRSFKKNKLPWKNITLEEAWKEFERTGSFSPDPVETGLYEGFSITNQNIQLAIWLGAKNIYLIGVDHFYDERNSSSAGTKLVHKAQNHFHPEYRKQGEIVNNAPVIKMNDAYTKTNAIALANGVNVINISRKTALNVFPKSSVEAVLESMGKQIK